MAARKKRVADTYLTHDNWDQEDDSQDSEDPGVFKKADEEELGKRTIRKAKRRGVGGDSGATGEVKTSSNPFASFGGFGSTGASLTFGAKPINTVKPAAPLKTIDTNKENNNFWGSKPEEQKSDFFSNRNRTETKPLPTFNQFTKLTKESSSENTESESESKIKNESESKTKSESESGKKETGNKTMDERSDFYKELCDLNISVLNWIKTHVEDNPCIDLQPVFADYKTHINNLETKYDRKRGSSVKEEAKATTTVANKDDKNVFKTPDNSSVTSTPMVAAGSINTTNTFSMLKSSTPISANPFGDLKTSGEKLFNVQASPFSFKPGISSVAAGPTTAAAPSVPSTVKEEGQGDPEDKVPEPERKTVVESDAFHQIRCKLFFKKGSEWKELGIGMLYLKPGADDEKIQLLVRMETSTGKVLLNVTVTKDTPTSRSGKNNVMVVTVPNPPVYSKPDEGDNSAPCTYLIRVKGATEADELFGKLKK